ncbi:unnamed protein product [Mucor hiemalis]
MSCNQESCNTYPLKEEMTERSSLFIGIYITKFSLFPSPLFLLLLCSDFPFSLSTFPISSLNKNMAPAVNLSLNPTIIHDTCFSKSCIETASSILNSIDMNVDPCSDFYQYTCGNWIRNAVIPEELAGFGILEVESKRHKEKLRTILDGTYADLLSSTISRESFRVDGEQNIKIDRHNFKIVKDYYTSCLDIDINSGEVLSKFFQDISELKSEVDYLEQQNRTFQITTKAVDILSYPKSFDGIAIEVGGLFSIEMMPDDNQKSRMSLVLFPPGEFNDVGEAPLQDQGSEILFELTSSLFSMANRTERDRERLVSLVDSGLNVLSDDQIHTVVDDAITVQNRLYELSKRTHDDKYYTYTLESVINLFPFVDWDNILNTYMPEGRDISDIRIQMYNIEYFSELNHFFGVNDPSRVLNTDAILNFLVLHKLYQEAPRLDPEVRKIMPDSPFQTRSSLCIDKVLENLGLLAGRFYSMIASHGETDRLKLEEIADNIKASLGNRIKHADWLDDSTRASAIKKLEGMNKAIAYSTYTPDQRSPSGMRDYMSGLSQSAGNFYDNEKSVIKWTLKTYWDTLGREMSSTEWIGVTTPQVVNAFNLLSKNSVRIDLGFLNKQNSNSCFFFF